MKLLVFDVEGTLFRAAVRLPGTAVDSTIWQSIAHELGPDAVKEEVETHQKWAQGGYRNYLAWMEDTIEIHRKYGLTETIFRKLISAAKYNPYVVETLSQIDRSYFEPLLISGGFKELAARAQIDFRIIHSFAACEYIFGDDGYLCSYNLLPCDFEGKIDFINLMLREYGLDSKDWVFVGDGENDIPIAKKAPVSIGYHPHEKLKEVVKYVINNFHELLVILEQEKMKSG
jgi:phosphoserine phosphatase